MFDCGEGSVRVLGHKITSLASLVVVDLIVVRVLCVAVVTVVEP